MESGRNRIQCAKFNRSKQPPLVQVEWWRQSTYIFLLLSMSGFSLKLPLHTYDILRYAGTFWGTRAIEAHRKMRWMRTLFSSATLTFFTAAVGDAVFGGGIINGSLNRKISFVLKMQVEVPQVSIYFLYIIDSVKKISSRITGNFLREIRWIRFREKAVSHTAFKNTGERRSR